MGAAREVVRLPASDENLHQLLAEMLHRVSELEM
jgi:hypothetical protein